MGTVINGFVRDLWIELNERFDAWSSLRHLDLSEEKILLSKILAPVADEDRRSCSSSVVTDNQSQLQPKPKQVTESV